MFTHFHFYQYRNFTDVRINVNAHNVFFRGNNGQGKTNVLEAVYYTCYASSFRTRNDSDIIQTGQKQMGITACYHENGLDNKIYIRHENKKKRITYNTTSLQRSELIGIFTCIPFVYNDIRFIMDGPHTMREFFNQVCALVDRDSIYNLQHYNRLLRQRNVLLREQSYALIEVYTEQLAAYGLCVIRARRKAVDFFNTYFSQIYQDLSATHDVMRIQYGCSWHDAENVQDACACITQAYNHDIKMKTSTTGPHRDRFVIYCNEKPVVNFASTGQIRLLGLLLRIMQLRYFMHSTGKSAIVLFDDVVLELDEKKRMRFFANIPVYHQAFYAFLSHEDIQKYNMGESYINYWVENGIIHEI